MKAEVFMTPVEMDPVRVAGATVVVVDVIRATTTIVEALANGARAIYPTSSTEEAVKLAASLGREDTLLCGERGTLKVEGFHLGNSPAEFSPAVVGGKRIVLSTTNGTAALLAVRELPRVLVGAFVNLSAVADAVRADPHVVVVCAGRDGGFALDDAMCAGHILRRIGANRELNDAARAAWRLAGGAKPGPRFLAGTEGGRALLSHGLADDLDICGQVDRHVVVPQLRDQALVAGG